MRPGYALYIHRFAHLIMGRTSALVAAMFFAVVLATQAQESIEEVALPPWSEPTLPSSEPAPVDASSATASRTRTDDFCTRTVASCTSRVLTLFV